MADDDIPHPESEERPWRFTVVRAHGLGKLRAEKSWRPIVAVTVGTHQCRELNLGCDGQNPNLKQYFQFHEADASSRIDICVYHRGSKKKNKKRDLVASACCTLQELARLQAEQQCKRKSVNIKLNGVSRQKGGAKPIPVILVAQLDLSEVSKVQPGCVREDKELDAPSEGLEDSGFFSSTSDSSEDPTFPRPENLEHHPESRVHAGYWSNSDDVHSEDERDPLLGHDDNELVIVPPLPETKESIRVDNSGYKLWFAASILPAYTEPVPVVDPRISTIDSIVDSFTPYRELREARLDSEYERVLAKLSAEWRFVGGSLAALSGLEAGVFGFSSATEFTINTLSRRAIAVGSVASGIGLAIDAWFLIAYCNATPTKFQKMALDVYGKYVFFCISARIPALCMFVSVLALMTFMLSVAWAAWPTAVLVISFLAGVLVSLQFIVYGVHCVVVSVAEVVRSVRKGVLRCLARLRPPPGPTPPSGVVARGNQNESPGK